MVKMSGPIQPAPPPSPTINNLISSYNTATNNANKIAIRNRLFSAYPTTNNINNKSKIKTKLTEIAGSNQLLQQRIQNLNKAALATATAKTNVANNPINKNQKNLNNARKKLREAIEKLKGTATDGTTPFKELPANLQKTIQDVYKSEAPRPGPLAGFRSLF